MLSEPRVKLDQGILDRLRARALGLQQENDNGTPKSITNMSKQTISSSSSSNDNANVQETKKEENPKTVVNTTDSGSITSTGSGKGCINSGKSVNSGSGGVTRKGSAPATKDETSVNLEQKSAAEQNKKGKNQVVEDKREVEEKQQSHEGPKKDTRRLFNISDEACRLNAVLQSQLFGGPRNEVGLSAVTRKGDCDNGKGLEMGDGKNIDKLMGTVSAVQKDNFNSNNRQSAMADSAHVKGSECIKQRVTTKSGQPKSVSGGKHVASKKGSTTTPMEGNIVITGSVVHSDTRGKASSINPNPSDVMKATTGNRGPSNAEKDPANMQRGETIRLQKDASVVGTRVIEEKSTEGRAHNGVFDSIKHSMHQKGPSSTAAMGKDEPAAKAVVTPASSINTVQGDSSSSATSIKSSLDQQKSDGEGEVWSESLNWPSSSAQTGTNEWESTQWEGNNWNQQHAGNASECPGWGQEGWGAHYTMEQEHGWQNQNWGEDWKTTSSGNGWKLVDGCADSLSVTSDARKRQIRFVELPDAQRQVRFNRRWVEDFTRWRNDFHSFNHLLEPATQGVLIDACRKAMGELELRLFESELHVARLEKLL